MSRDWTTDGCVYCGQMVGMCHHVTCYIRQQSAKMLVGAGDTKDGYLCESAKAAIEEQEQDSGE